MAIDTGTLALTFNHLVFPPRLPGKQDDKVEDVETDILARLLTATRTIKDCLGDDAHPIWGGLEESLKTCRRVNEHKYVNKIALLKALEELKPHHAVILRVTEQNAGVIIRPYENEIIFEAFEASPTAEETLASKGAMQWDFPQVAASLPRSEFEKPVFQENLVSFFESASLEPLEEFAAKTHKAGVKVAEARDTVDPALITHFLMTLLEVNGSRVYPPLLRKRVKDDVCWDNAELPWRRSPLWLILRVSVQRLLYLTLGEKEGRVQYKFLICALLSQLLKQCVSTLDVDQCCFLRAKLCRRLAKLESEAGTTSSSGGAYSILMNGIGSMCRSDIEVANSAITARWSVFKSSSRRKVPPLPRRAPGQDLQLTLSNSGAYLRRQIQNQFRFSVSAPPAVNLAILDTISHNSATEFYTKLLGKYSALEQLEMNIESLSPKITPFADKCMKQCQELADEIRDYLKSVGDAYHGNSEQMSTFILNIFTLWVNMDRCATKAHPLLRDYYPYFEPEMLDVLMLWRRSDLDRLQAIQEYIDDRCFDSETKITIFADPQKGCFADRYFECQEYAHIEDLEDLEERIDDACEKARETKEREMERVNADYKERTEQMVQHSCTQKRRPDGGHDIRGCTHCWHVRCRRRLQIQVHEDFLPADDGKKKTVQRRATLFELNLPPAFAAYRDATWEIINALCPPITPRPEDAPQVLLKDYDQLARFRRKCESFSLASRSKSYLGTHYNFRNLPVQPHTILLPLGLNFSYFDSRRRIWAADLQQEFSFAHHMALNIPKELPFSTLYSSEDFEADADGPSSYEIIASIPECPPEVTVHEYTTHQTLISGKKTRWFSILTELGSSNINFSLQDTMALFRRLALQAGPALEENSLREIHSVFEDVEFCRTLLNRVGQHIDAISENWRENYYMETLLTLTIRVCVLGAQGTLLQANALLLKIRNVTLGWTKHLRNETRTTKDAHVAQRTARYGFLSALLCRRTFSLQAYGNRPFDRDSFKVFVEATLAMQENLVIDIGQLSNVTLHVLIRDIKMAYRMREITRDAVEQHQASLESAINTVWPSPDGVTRIYQPWEFLPAPNEWWVTSTVSTTAATIPQVVHYHMLEGHMLIDGKALGKLPATIRDSEILKDLFQNQQLVAFPSNLPGMSYMLSIPQNGYYVHLGYRDQELVIQAQRRQELLQLIPKHVFGDTGNFDLPEPLVKDCVHWLDLRSTILEARRKPKIWTSTHGNWHINLYSYTGMRNKRSNLVDPKSKSFSLVSQIFHHFAPPNMLTVYQPLASNLCVEIKAMDLRFQVNRRGLLECRELASEIDPNQDAGTLYGLESMIVMRDARNPSQRSILTTLGRVRYHRSGIHVNVRFENTGNYARYSIDPVLGRLHCPPEPRLLYHRALIHALTSFILPDPLTRRTGTEEALRYLQAGAYQPWTPLSPPVREILQSLANLTPRRFYYPNTLKKQQAVTWDIHLTTTIQHDTYKLVVDSIFEKSHRLQPFHLKTAVPETNTQVWTIEHLRERAHWRRSIYERPEALSTPLLPPHDFPYIGRNTWADSKSVVNSHEIVSLLHARPDSIHTTRVLKDIMKEWPLIGGYTTVCRPCLISDCLRLDLAHEWGGLVNLCRECSPENVYLLMFQLGLMAFRATVDMRIMRTLVAYFLLDDLRKLDIPQYLVVNGPDIDEELSYEELLDHIQPHCLEYRPVLTKKMRKKSGEERFKIIEDQRQRHEENCLNETYCLALLFYHQWPAEYPPDPAGEYTESHDEDAVYDDVYVLWKKRYEARQFSNHISRVQAVLDNHYTRANPVKEIPTAPDVPIYGMQAWYRAIIPRFSHELLNRVTSRPVSKDTTPTSDRFKVWAKQTFAGAGDSVFVFGETNSTPEIKELSGIIAPFIDSGCSVRSSYGRDLAQSMEAFKQTMREATPRPRTDIDLGDEISRAQATIASYHGRICDKVTHEDSRSSWLKLADLWPSMAPTLILEQLRSQSHHMLGDYAKKQLIRYALAIVKAQHLIRVEDASLKGDERRLRQEHDNPGHVNWDPSAYPDWLLLEIDSNIQIREDQVNVALEMISPTFRSNSVLQMNMGQGKTSVIMPMVACVLANGTMLSRLLVPKALLSQTAQMLQSRLGGLLGRELTHIPFSRRTPTAPELIEDYKNLHVDMLKSSGIILAIPEHLLSFKLCGLQQVSDQKPREASQMVTIQTWMNQVSRDVLDECDFTLATKTQLIYPSGAQLTVDGHPHRWKVTETILGLVAHHLRSLTCELPGSIDVVERGISAFPMAYFLRSEAEEALVQRLVDDICNSSTILPTLGCTPTQRQVIRKFISEEKVDQVEVNALSTLFRGSQQGSWKSVHLLRGLFVHGLLLLCLKKRWNVQYGLHPNRDPVAVPFHAKGVPSEQAEWGHPDVAIILTCLAFYYQGLNHKQIQQSLQVVLKSNDPATEYDRWIQSCATLPDPLRHWNIINVDDEGQVNEIWHHLRFSTVVVNHFLNHFVFPAHAKQFSSKLQASGWDVPLFSSTDVSPKGIELGPGITTGFSGTNDTRRLLPLTIKQQDLPGLSHTNAEVLTYLLQPRNRQYIVAVDKFGKRLSETQLLGNLVRKEIRILIDAGAFILEMDNRTLVKEWLKVDTLAQAAVYFDSNNDARVEYRNGRNVPLIATPFSDNLNECLVYLDEAHTRGTDLNLPSFACGALTLGLNQTKDHTVQAAMRMRQLSTTQSITYISPPEVHQSIQDVCNRPDGNLDSAHVVTWLLDQTCNNIEELQGLYFSQGRDFCHRMQAAQTYHEFLTNPAHQKAYMAALQQPEQQLLDQLYAPESTTDRLKTSMNNLIWLTGKLARFQDELKERALSSTNLKSAVKSSAMDEVEQEREVAFQVEEERQVQRPSRMEALVFPGLDRSISTLISSGKLYGCRGYRKASELLEATRISVKHGVQASELLPHLWISNEFYRTVKVKKGKILDNFTRPVNWIIWSSQSGTAMVIIPEEAELVIPLLESYKTPGVHLLMYAAPVVRKMLHFNNLDYYAIPSLPAGWKPPSWLPFEVGILAGRLYFSFSEYSYVRERLKTAELTVSNGDTQPISSSLLAFLGEWLAVRRQGQDITHTPMGYVCHGWPLRQDHPFFMSVKPADSVRNSTVKQWSGLRKDEEEEDFDFEVEDEWFIDGDGNEK